MTLSAPYEKSKSLGSGGSMVARLKLKNVKWIHLNSCEFIFLKENSKVAQSNYLFYLSFRFSKHPFISLGASDENKRERDRETTLFVISLSLSLSPYFIATSSNCGNLLKLYGTKMCTMKIDIHSNNPGDVTMDNPQPMSKG